jgi:hypothetical protein
MAKKKLTDDELVLDGYKALYAAATPSVDFEELVNNCLRYVDRSGKTHYTEKPLSIDECREKEWRKDIEYMNYELEEDKYVKIIEDKIKEHKLTGIRAKAFRNKMFLGAGPAFKKNKED